MKTINFNNKEYEIPTSWDEVSLDMQCKVTEVAAIQPHVKMLGIIAGYTGIPVEELKSVKIDEVSDLMAGLEFMQEKIPTTRRLEWEFEGHKYSVIKNLSDMEFQDFVSIQTILAENEESYYKALPIVVAILAKRKDETLDDFDIHERAKIMGRMPISIASSIGSFFLLNENYYKLLTHLSSHHAQQKLLLGKARELRSTTNRWVQQRGTTMRYKFLMGLIAIYSKYLERRLEKHFKSTQSKSSTKSWSQTLWNWLTMKLKIKARKNK
jgi:hypothetical protein